MTECETRAYHDREWKSSRFAIAHKCEHSEEYKRTLRTLESVIGAGERLHQCKIRTSVCRTGCTR